MVRSMSIMEEPPAMFDAESEGGGPGRSPTCDLRVRSALLYATELPGHVCVVYQPLAEGFEAKFGSQAKFREAMQVKLWAC